MNQLDVFYRALIDYRKMTVDNRDCDAMRKSIANANAQEDALEIEKTTCTVDEDWIEAIEKGLVFVEKAIREERQFIRSNGEVLPIEKVKRIDRESVEHLAKHSNLLTTKPEEGEDIIPDQLYTVERLSDFAVYENRFLYMLLCYLRDFITLRYNKILDLTTTYDGSLTMNKTVSYRKQKIKYKLEMSEVRKNDWFLREHNEAKEAISRIDLILKSVIHYLNTPLMEEVSKSPMLKPPITKTNVLKMNQNFKGAVALYEYVTAYDKPGFTSEKHHKILNPLPDGVADEIAETIALTSFLTYEHGLGIESFLKEAYEEEEQRRKDEEANKLVEQIKNLKKRIANAEVSPEEYMLMLEKRNRSLESDSAQLVIAKQEIETLNSQVQTLTLSVNELEERKQFLESEVERLIREHEAEVAALKAAHEEEITNLKTYYEDEIEALKAAHEEEVTTLNMAHVAEVNALNEEHEIKVTNLIEEHEGEVERLRMENEADRAAFEQGLKEKDVECLEREARKQAECDREVAKWVLYGQDKDAKIAELYKDCELLEDRRKMADARVNALRYKFGLITNLDEFTTETSFGELERQYHSFKKLFKVEWKRVKKKMRDEFLWSVWRKKKEEKRAKKNANKQEEVKKETSGTPTTNLEPNTETAKEEKAVVGTETFVLNGPVLENQVEQANAQLNAQLNAQEVVIEQVENKEVAVEEVKEVQSEKKKTSSRKKKTEMEQTEEPVKVTTVELKEDLTEEAKKTPRKKKNS